MSENDPRRTDLRGVTYDEELELVRGRVQAGARLSHREVSFLIHGRIMEDLVAWLKETGRSYVDVRGMLDQRRDYLLTWVHLHPDANRRVARAFGEEILQRTCPSPRAESTETDLKRTSEQ